MRCGGGGDVSGGGNGVLKWGGLFIIKLYSSKYRGQQHNDIEFPFKFYIYVCCVLVHCGNVLLSAARRGKFKQIRYGLFILNAYSNIGHEIPKLC